MRLLLAASLLCGPWAAARGAPSPAEREAFDWGRRFMTGGASRPREALDGDYRSAFGTLVDPSCRIPLGPEQSAATRERIQELNSRALGRLDSDIAASLRVVRACGEAYPELTGLLRDAVAILWRSVVHCRPTRELVQAGLSPFTIAYATYRHSEMTPESHGRRLGEEARARHLYYIVLADSLEDFQSRWPQPARMETLIHESLHYTGANSRYDHNWVETLRFDKTAPCALNPLDDRIIFLLTLCGFPSLVSVADIRSRIEACRDAGSEPLGRGCIAPLVSVVEGPGPREPGYGPAPDDTRRPRQYGNILNEREARMLCGRLQEEGARERVASSAVSGAHQRALLALREFVGREARGLLDDSPMPPPRYLAPLSAEERRAVAADPSFSRLGLLCGAREDGSIEPVGQRFECPLRSGNPLESVTSRLVAFNDAEAELNRGTRRLAEAMAAVKGGGLDWDALEREVNGLYGRLCPSRTDGGAFVPRLCLNGRTVLLETVSAYRRGEDLSGP